MKKIFVLSALLLVFFACSEKPAKKETKIFTKENSIEKEEEKLPVKEEIKENTLTIVEIDTTYFGPCEVKVRYTAFPQYPMLTAAIEADVNKYISDIIEESVNRKKYADSGAPEEDDFVVPCELSLRDSIYRADDSFVSVVINGSRDLCMHPVFFDSQYNYDVKEGKFLTVSDLFDLSSAENVAYFNSQLEDYMSGINCEAFDRPWGYLWASEANCSEEDRIYQKPTVDGMQGFCFSNDYFYAYYGQYAFGFNAFVCTRVSVPLEALRHIMKKAS